MKRLIPIPLRELTYGEEFWTPSMKNGHVVTTGWTWWEDRTGRRVRINATLVRFGTVEKLFRAEMKVLVEHTRTHTRWTPAAEKLRWNQYLKEPGEIATVGEVMQAKGAQCESR